MNVRYLTGFTGTNGACIVTRDERLFLTDFRYVEQARGAGARATSGSRPGATCSATWPGGCAGAPGFEDAHVTVAEHAQARREAAPRAWSWWPPAGSWRSCAR